MTYIQIACHVELTHPRPHASKARQGKMATAYLLSSLWSGRHGDGGWCDLGLRFTGGREGPVRASRTWRSLRRCQTGCRMQASQARAHAPPRRRRLARPRITSRKNGEKSSTEVLNLCQLDLEGAACMFNNTGSYCVHLLSPIFRNSDRSLRIGSQ